MRALGRDIGPAGAGGGRVRLASVHIYPLKAAAAVDLDQCLVERWQQVVFGQNLIPDRSLNRTGQQVDILSFFWG